MIGFSKGHGKTSVLLKTRHGSKTWRHEGHEFIEGLNTHHACHRDRPGAPLPTYLCTPATLAPLGLQHLPFLYLLQSLADSVPTGWHTPSLLSLPS